MSDILVFLIVDSNDEEWTNGKMGKVYFISCSILRGSTFLKCIYIKVSKRLRGTYLEASQQQQHGTNSQNIEWICNYCYKKVNRNHSENMYEEEDSIWRWFDIRDINMASWQVSDAIQVCLLSYTMLVLTPVSQALSALVSGKNSSLMLSIFLCNSPSKQRLER